MPSFSDVLAYFVQTLLLWGERLFARDAANPNYRYAWAPPIYGRHVGFVICNQRNDVQSVNVGPSVEDWRKSQEAMQEARRRNEEKAGEKAVEKAGPPGGLNDDDSGVPNAVRRRGNRD